MAELVNMYNYHSNEKINNNVYDVLYQSDENYVPVLAASMKSLITNNKHLDFRIVIIDCGINEKSQKKLLELANETTIRVIFIKKQTLEKKLFNSKIASYQGFRKNKSSYIKILYPYYENAAKRVVFLDCDTIVLGDISPLFLLDLKGKPMAAVMDCTVDQVYKNIIGLKESEPYYNSGVMVIDSAAWIKSGIYEKIQEQVDAGIKYNTVDQDYINIAVKGNSITLDARYNFQPLHLVYSPSVYLSVYHKHDKYYSVEELVEAQQNIVILHFFRYLGKHPWDKNSLHPDENEYRKWISQTPWKNYKWKTNKIAFSIQIERIAYILLPRSIFLKLFKFMHDKMLIH